jgi:hypothetical protein
MPLGLKAELGSGPYAVTHAESLRKFRVLSFLTNPPGSTFKGGCRHFAGRIRRPWFRRGRAQEPWDREACLTRLVRYSNLFWSPSGIRTPDSTLRPGASHFHHISPLFNTVMAFVANDSFSRLSLLVLSSVFLISALWNCETRCARDLALSQVRRVRARRDDWRHGNCDSFINNLPIILLSS